MRFLLPRVSRSIVAVCLLALPSIAAAADQTVTWTSTRTGKTWTVFEFHAAASLTEMKQNCEARGLLLPNTTEGDMDRDVLEFLGTALDPERPGFDHFTVRGIEVRLFAVANSQRKEERYQTSVAFHREISSYQQSLQDLCRVQGNTECVATTQSWIDSLAAKDRVLTQCYRELGHRMMFVDVLGMENNLEVLEQEYGNFYVQKESYETARTLLIPNATPQQWSGLLCVSP